MPRRAQSDGSWWVAKESFSGVDPDGDPVIVTRDRTRLQDGDPLLRKYPEYFARLDPGTGSAAVGGVEQATAAPGEQRGAPR